MDDEKRMATIPKGRMERRGDGEPDHSNLKKATGGKEGAGKEDRKSRTGENWRTKPKGKGGDPLLSDGNVHGWELVKSRVKTDNEWWRGYVARVGDVFLDRPSQWMSSGGEWR